jgi:hypothetical protein
MISLSEASTEESTRWSDTDTLIPTGSGKQPTPCELIRVAFSTAARSIGFPDSSMERGVDKRLSWLLNRNNKAVSDRKAKTGKLIKRFTLVQLERQPFVHRLRLSSQIVELTGNPSVLTLITFFV